MGHVVNPILLRLGVVTPWIAASYSRKNNKQVQYTIENFLIYKYICKFFNTKVYLKVLSKIKKRRKKYLKHFFFYNFPYIFSHLTIARINAIYQLNLFFYDTSLQHSLNIKNKRFYKKKKKNVKKRKKIIIRRKKTLKKKKVLKKYKAFITYNNLMFKLKVKNKVLFNKYLVKKYPNNFNRQLRFLFKRKSKRKFKKKKKFYYGYPRSFYQKFYKKQYKLRRRYKVRSYYKQKKRMSGEPKIQLRKLHQLMRLKKYLNKKKNSIALSLLKKTDVLKNVNKLNRYTVNAKLLFMYKLNPLVKRIMNLKNKMKSYYYKTRNRFKFKNISLIRNDYFTYIAQKKKANKKKYRKIKKVNYLVKRSKGKVMFSQKGVRPVDNSKV